MTYLGKIVATITTGDLPDAGSSDNDAIFLGIGGREFRLNKKRKQFRQNSTDEFIIGKDYNIENQETNDLPSDGTKNSFKLEYTDLDEFPKYIRYQPNSNYDKWNVDAVSVEVHEYNKNGDTNNKRTFKSPSGSLWLSKQSGLYIGLKE